MATDPIQPVRYPIYSTKIELVMVGTILGRPIWIQLDGPPEQKEQDYARVKEALHWLAMR